MTDLIILEGSLKRVKKKNSLVNVLASHKKRAITEIPGYIAKLDI